MAHYLGEISFFDICQAHCQLESDYNVDGIVIERPSNRRRNESTGCQLSRMNFNPGMRWVNIEAAHDPDCDDPGDETVREIYMHNVLKWGLPISAELMRAMRRFFVPEFLAQYPQTAGDDYLQGR